MKNEQENGQANVFFYENNCNKFPVCPIQKQPIKQSTETISNPVSSVSNTKTPNQAINREPVQTCLNPVKINQSNKRMRFSVFVYFFPRENTENIHIKSALIYESTQKTRKSHWTVQKLTIHKKKLQV